MKVSYNTVHISVVVRVCCRQAAATPTGATVQRISWRVRSAYPSQQLQLEVVTAVLIPFFSSTSKWQNKYE